MQHLPAWSHALSVRNARLDEQHIILMDLSNELLELLGLSAAWALGFGRQHDQRRWR